MKNTKTPPMTGQIDPKGTLPNFLETLSGQVLQPYLGLTHGCVAGHEVAVIIQGLPDKFYGVNKNLIVWGKN